MSYLTRSPLSVRRLLLAAASSLLMPLSASVAAVNYDTAWTFVHDGGKWIDGTTSIQDAFYGVHCMPNGDCVCVGASGDTTAPHLLLFMKLDKKGKVLQKKLISTFNEKRSQYNNQTAYSISPAANGDLLIGAKRYGGPWILRTDTDGNIKWATWLYDSLKMKSLLSGSGCVNSIRETSDGKIICAAGDEFPKTTNNYACGLVFDSTGKLLQSPGWNNMTGYTMSGFSIEEASKGRFLITGRVNLVCFDTLSKVVWNQSYATMIPGVGGIAGNVMRVKWLPDGRLMACGQAIEGRTYQQWKTYRYDGWWAQIDPEFGHALTRDTLGGVGNDNIYDFTQLTDNRLAFVGRREGSLNGSPLWVFVTDSSGHEVLWEKDVGIYTHRSVITMFGFSIAATPDNGFTVVGKGAIQNNTGTDAFAVHFVPTSSPVRHASVVANEPLSVKTLVSGSKVTFTVKNGGTARLSIHDARGRVVDRLGGARKSASLSWDISNVGAGVYFYRVESAGSQASGRIVVSP